MIKTRVAVVVRAGLSAWLVFAACGVHAQSLLSVPPGPLFVEEGETTMITLLLDSPAAQDLEINYLLKSGTGIDLNFSIENFDYPGMSANDYTVVPESSVTIEAGDTEVDISIRIHGDAEIDGVRELLAIVFPPPSAGAGYRLNPADGSTTILVLKEGVCDRNKQIVQQILDATGEPDCAEISATEMHEIGTLNFSPFTEPLRRGDFWNFPQVGFLDLSSRSLHGLPDGIFGGIGNVSNLDLSGNTFTTISTEVFADSGFLQHGIAQTLQELYLNDLPLTELPAGFFGTFIGVVGTDRTERINLRGVHLPTDAGGEPLLPLDVGFVQVSTVSATAVNLKLTVVQGAPYDITADLSTLRATVSDDQLLITRGKTESEVFTLTQTTDEPGVVSAALRPPPDMNDCRRPSLLGEEGEDHACYAGIAFSPAKPGFRLGVGAPTLRIKLFLEGALE